MIVSALVEGASQKGELGGEAGGMGDNRHQGPLRRLESRRGGVWPNSEITSAMALRGELGRPPRGDTQAWWQEVEVFWCEDFCFFSVQ